MNVRGLLAPATAGIALAGLLLAGCSEEGLVAPPIRDAANRIVIYHGVCVCNSAKTAPDFLPWHKKADFARLRDWGFNLVRYQVYWEAIEPTRGVYNEAYLAATLERLRWLQDLGIDVFLDIHQDLYARKFTGNGFPTWTIQDGGNVFHHREPWNLNYLEPAIIACYDNFWDSADLKAKYVSMVEYLLKKTDGMPNVIGVDVINEPFPGLNLDFEPRILSEFYQDLLAMWTRNGFRAKLFFEPMMFNSAGLATLLTFRPNAQCVFAPHYYDPLCHEGSPYTGRARVWLRRTMAMRVREARQLGAPVVFGEFGIGANVDGFLDFLSDFLDQTDKYQFGWTYYSYDWTNDEAFGFIGSGDSEKPQLTRLVRVYPQRIAGDHPLFRCGDRRFDLVYEPSGTDAPTVIFVPRALQGVQVLVNGRSVPYDASSGCLEVRDQHAWGRQTVHIEWQ